MKLMKFSLIAIIVLFIWISFFPYRIQYNYHATTNIILSFIFLIHLIKKRFLIFEKKESYLWIFLVTIIVNVFFAQKKKVVFYTYLDLAIPMIFVYYLLKDCLKEASNFIILAKTICVCSILVSLLGIFEALFGFNPLYENFIYNEYYERNISVFIPTSTQFHPAPLGTYLICCLPFNFLLFKEQKHLFRSLGAVGIIFNIVVIILAFSRQVLLGFVATVLFYLYLQKRKTLIVLFLAIMVSVILISTFLPYPVSRFGINRLLYNKDMSGTGIFSNYRLDRLLMTKRIFMEHPFVGLGFQHFRARFYEFYPREGSVKYEYMIPDNMYLTFLAETGLIGFIGFLVFLRHFYRVSKNKLKLLSDNSQQRLRLIAVPSVFVRVLVNMGGYELFYWPNQYIFFCIMVGVIEYLTRRNENLSTC